MTIERQARSMLAGIVITMVLAMGAAACNQPGGPATTDQPPVDSGPHVTPDSPTDPLFPQPTVIPSE